MTLSSDDTQTLASKAARGAGFPSGQAERFGRAAVVHLAEGRDGAALTAALSNPSDSPILRLAPLCDDILAACTAMRGPAELTLTPGDTALALAYARLAPVLLTDCVLVDRDDQPRLRVTADLTTPLRPSLPKTIHVPQSLVDQLSQYANAAQTRR